MIHTCAKNQANQGGSCISGVSVLQKVTLNSTCDTTEMNLKFYRPFVLVLEDTLGPSGVTHYNRKNTTFCHCYSQRCHDGRVV